MKKILICAATKIELEPIYEALFKKKCDENKICVEEFYNIQLHFAITGIGIMPTIYNLLKLIQKSDYDVALNIGLAGSFNSKKITIGHTVNIVEEILGDFGVTDNENFKTVFEIGLLDKNTPPFKNGKLINPYNFEVAKNYVTHSNIRSLTVCNVSGEMEQIKFRRAKFKAEVENMEGAGFFYVMLNEQIPFMEVRAISNIIEPRNKENWNILKALSSLQETIKLMILDIANSI